MKYEALKQAIEAADAVVVGAGAGLSTAAGLSFEGERFNTYFADFRDRYGIRDIYSGGFYPFKTLEEYWAWWSRSILYNRYEAQTNDTYALLLRLVEDSDYFVITTNVDHQFQQSGFDKARLFYTQGDFGLLQCSRACHPKTYDNEALIREMVAAQEDMKVPSHLVPYCPHCGAPMTTNLRSDDTFVEDEGWHHASARYQAFLQKHSCDEVVYLELGVGGNTPAIIKYPFWRRTLANPNATYASLNIARSFIPDDLEDQSILLTGDIHALLQDLVD